MSSNDTVKALIEFILVCCTLCGLETVNITFQLKVMDPVYGWVGFRQSCGMGTWQWLVAALKPRFEPKNENGREQYTVLSGSLCQVLLYLRIRLQEFVVGWQ